MPYTVQPAQPAPIKRATLPHKGVTVISDPEAALAGGLIDVPLLLQTELFVLYCGFVFVGGRVTRFLFPGRVWARTRACVRVCVCVGGGGSEGRSRANRPTSS